jgi:Bacterial Ig-like domain (group 2)
MKASLTAMSSCLRTWGILIVALVVVGCGGGSDNGGTGDFVFTGNNAGGASPGSMTFNFVKAQNPLPVPQATTDIRFRFYSEAGGAGTLLQQETRPFASTITIDPVNGQTRSVVITALGENDYPVLQSLVGVAELSGNDIVVDFSGADTEVVTILALVVSPPSANIDSGSTQQFNATLTFSNGEQLPANNVMWSSTGQASVDVNTGLVTATTDGAASVTATRGDLATTVDIIVGEGPILNTLTVTPDALTVGTGTQIPFEVTGVDQNGDPFALSDVVWSVEAGTAVIETLSGLATFDTENLVTIRATVGPIFDDATIEVLESVPTITFADTSELVFLSTQIPNIAMPGEVTITDNQDNLNGGTLRIRSGTPGTVFDVTFDMPDNPGIGTVTGDNSNNVSVLLNNTATPELIADLIEDTTIAYTSNFGSGTIVVELSDGQGNNAFPATRGFSIPDPTPMVNLDSGTVTFDVRATPNISAAATVTDDVDPMTTGTLAFSLSGDVADAEFAVPATVGTVNDTDPSNVTVDIMNADLADIAAAINGTTIAFGGSKGSGTIQVTLTDADGNTSATATREFQLTPLNLTVADSEVLPNQFATIAAAIAEVDGAAGADGSTITVLPAYTAFEAAIDMTTGTANLDNLTLNGTGAGQSAGVVPFAGSRTGTVVSLILVGGRTGVTFDGFDVRYARFDNITGGTIRNCAFSFGFASRLIDLRPASTDITIENCGFSIASEGIRAVVSTDGTFIGNAFFADCVVGLSLSSPDGTEVITGNGFSCSGIHLDIFGGASVTASGNDFGNTGGRLRTSGTAELNAQGNWWGQDTGPLVNPPDTYSQVVEAGTGTIDATNPLITDPFPGFGT